MNSSIMIKGANFSNSNVGKLKLQKLEVVKAGDGMCRVNGNTGELYIQTTSDYGDIWKPGDEIAYSEEIMLPSGTKYLFGKISQVLETSYINPYLLDQRTTCPVALCFWCFYRSSTNRWHAVTNVFSVSFNKVLFLSRKDGLFANNEYSAATIQGGLYGTPFLYDDIVKMKINWLKIDSKTAPEIGMTVPELYAGF